MRLVSSSNDNKQYALDRENYTINFTLINMGSYIGFRSRQWWEESPENWKTMGIDIESEDDKKSIHSEFLVDDHGELLSAIVTDKYGYRRIRSYYNDPINNTKEREEHLRGKGMIKEDGRWIQDTIVVPGNNLLGLGKSYAYDENTGKYIDENGVEAPETILKRFELLKLLQNAGKQVAEKFVQLRAKTDYIPQEMNIDEEISL